MTIDDNMSLIDTLTETVNKTLTVLESEWTKHHINLVSKCYEISYFTNFLENL